MAQSFSVSDNAQIEIRDCHNRVTVVGWDDAHSVVCDAAARQEGNTIIVRGANRVNMRVPRTASVRITHCEDDVRVEDVAGKVELLGNNADVVLRGLAEVIVRDQAGDLIAKGVSAIKGEGSWEGDLAGRGIESLTVERVDGDVSLGDVGTIALQSVDGDTHLRGVRGALSVDQVEGDFALRDSSGDVRLSHLEGDLVVSGLRGALDAPDVKGDAVLSLAEVKNVRLSAKGDVILNLPPDANAEIELDAPNGDLIARGGIQTQERDDKHLRGILGSGGAKVAVESLHGDLVLRLGSSHDEAMNLHRELHASMHAIGKEFGGLGRQIADEVRQSVHESLADMNIRHRHGRSRRSMHEEREPHPQEEQSAGFAPGSPERKAILDAIARGEMSVDEAIRRINGEE